MTSFDRRAFLAGLGKAGAALATGSWLEAIGYAQVSRGPARVRVQALPAVGDFDRRVLGSFLEHLGRAIYTGVYQPGSPHSDATGFRTDVVREVKELGVPIVRYPGGNFVSGYNWLDGVGPKAQRPAVLDRAWNSMEPNQFGTNEFIEWCRLTGSEPLLGLNFGTGSAEMAVALVEYCNVERGTKWSELRRSHGYAAPHAVKYWCLGNEMDGDWQIGHGTPHEYGQLALKTARAMRQLDPSLELVVCGSSSASMPLFGTWERIVLEETYDEVDYISCHAYYEEKDGDLGSFLASAVDMDGFIDTVVATADHVKAVRGSDKTVNISFDEWNVWYLSRWENVEKIEGLDNWPVAPRLLEDVYSVADAVVFGNLLISLIRHADRVTSASLAQLVNVIAPIMTEPGGPAWRQTTFFPFSITSRLAQGDALELKLDAPTYETAQYGEVPLVDAVATFDAESGRSAVFLVNRSQDEAVTLTVDVASLGDVSVLESHTLADDDVYAKNTLEDRERVAPRANDSVRIEGGELTITLPPVSWTALSLG